MFSEVHFNAFKECASSGSMIYTTIYPSMISAQHECITHLHVEFLVQQLVLRGSHLSHTTRKQAVGGLLDALKTAPPTPA